MLSFIRDPSIPNFVLNVTAELRHNNCQQIGECREFGQATTEAQTEYQPKQRMNFKFKDFCLGKVSSELKLSFVIPKFARDVEIGPPQ
jgi:hypothetical protein